MILRNQRSRAMADWSLLPSPLVDYVAGFLSVADQARMAAACKPWRAAMADGLCRRNPVPSIWLLFPPHTIYREENHEDCCEFRSFSEAMRRRYIFRMPAAETLVIGSWNGWLLLEDESSRVQAFNPLTEANVFFPPSDGVCSIGKAIVVPPKAGLDRSNSPVLVATLCTWRDSCNWLELAFAAAGDDVWTVLVKASTSVSARSYFHDIVAHDGKLYALDMTCHVLVFDFGGEKPSSSSSSSRPTVTLIKVEPHSNLRCAKSLAVISGELILVQWWTDENWPFEVFRLRAGPQKRFSWVTTRELAGHAILHSFDDLLALPVSKYRELTADCLYTVEEDETNHKSAGLTVMNMATRAIRSEKISTPSSYTPFWFLPNRGS